MKLTLHVSGTIEDAYAFLEKMKQSAESPVGSDPVRALEITVDIPRQPLEFGDDLRLKGVISPARFPLKDGPGHDPLAEPGPTVFPEDLDTVLVAELDLEARTYSCLKRAGVQTIGDLVHKTEQDLRAIPHLPALSREEIKAALGRHGLELRTEEDPLDLILIEELELGVRAYNHLKRVGTQTIGDLVRKTRKEILAIPNIGQGSEEEIRETLRARGLHLRGDGPTGKEEVTIEQLDLSTGTRDRLQEAGFRTVGDLLKQSWEDLRKIPDLSELGLKKALLEQGVGLRWDRSTVHPSGMENISVEELTLDARASNILGRAGIVTVDDLINRSPSWLKRLPNCGDKAVEQIVEALHARGLDFKHND